MKDNGKGQSRVSTLVGTHVEDRITESAKWEIQRYANDKDYQENKQYTDEEAFELFGIEQNTEIEGNLLLNEGINNLWTVACSATGTKFDNTNAYIGVGDSSTAEGATQTELQAVTNRWYQVMDGGYPTYGTSQLATFLITVASANGNFAWNEMTISAGASTGASPPTGTLNLCRKVSAQGTKQSGQTWVITYTVTLS